MLEYITVFEYNPEDSEGSISIMLSINQELLELGEKYQEVCEAAYMNGYNWQAIFSHLVNVEHKGKFDELDYDSEADTFVAILPLSKDGKEKAKLLAEMMSDFIKNEEKALEYIKKYSEEIEWD